MSVIAFNPCISCGACCAYFRASFYWSEADPAFYSQLGGIAVPPELVEPLNTHLVVMKGTNSKTPRCICLDGEIGQQVACSIYPVRSSTCRDFDYSGKDGRPHDRCDRARQAWGLDPLLPPIIHQPLSDDTPRVA